MNYKQAVELAQRGSCIRRKRWEESRYLVLQFKDSDYLTDYNDCCFKIWQCKPEDEQAIDWEIFSEELDGFPEEEELHDFSWALQQMKLGWKVCCEGWSIKNFLFLYDGGIINKFGDCLNNINSDLVFREDWQLYSETRKTKDELIKTLADLSIKTLQEIVDGLEME